MDTIIDSALTKEEALQQNPSFVCPEEILQQQVLVSVKYWSFDKREHQGQIVVASGLQQSIEEIFAALLLQKFPIQSVIPVADKRFGWDDIKSMQANNTSGFNYRYVANTTRLSDHARGFSVDINPLFNPQFIEGASNLVGASYDISRAGTIAANSDVVKVFKEHGWDWGGDWKERTDYQHFTKVVISA